MRGRLWGSSPMGRIPPNDGIDVGKRLRLLRSEKGLSLRALAELSGLNFNTLSLIENAKSSPSVSTLQRLAIALDVPITTFFEVEEKTDLIIPNPKLQII